VRRGKIMNVAMVGVGGFGAYRRARMRETGLFRIVAAYDINKTALEKCREEDGAKPADSYEALLKTPGIEAVFISTGAKFHASQAMAAMRRGLHVFIEKPLCATQREMRELISLQKKTGVVAGCGHADHAHDAASLTIKRMIDRGDFGKIATFEKTTAHSGGLRIKPGDWRGDPRKNPGGMLFQCGVHGIHELMFYFGPISAVQCAMRYDVHTTLTADVAHCILEFDSGLVGTLSAYHVTPYRHTFNIYGTRMNLYVDARFFDEGTRYLVQPCRSNEKEEQRPLRPSGRTDVCGNIRSFYNAVRNGGEPYPSLKDGARAVAVVFAAEEAAKTGRKVKVAKIT